MTRILFLPNETAFYTLDSILTHEKLVSAVNSGRWLPPGEMPPSDSPAPDRPILYAVRLGPNTVLIFHPIDLDQVKPGRPAGEAISRRQIRSEEHTSELQSPKELVCRLLL